MMKTLFIESKQKNLRLNLKKSEISKIPKKIFLVYTIQYKNLAEKINEILKKNKIKIINFQQVLGCSNIKTNYPVLLIGTGDFHAINLCLQSPFVYVLDNNKIKKISSKEIKKLELRKKTALLKYLSAENIGILVSTKPGQSNLKKALFLKKQLEKKSKRVFIFLSNNININQFENFNIDSWINTACPGISYQSSNIINIKDVS